MRFYRPYVPRWFHSAQAKQTEQPPVEEPMPGTLRYRLGYAIGVILGIICLPYFIVKALGERSGDYTER